MSRENQLSDLVEELLEECTSLRNKLNQIQGCSYTLSVNLRSMGVPFVSADGDEMVKKASVLELIEIFNRNTQ